MGVGVLESFQQTVQAVFWPLGCYKVNKITLSCAASRPSAVLQNSEIFADSGTNEPFVPFSPNAHVPGSDRSPQPHQVFLPWKQH